MTSAPHRIPVRPVPGPATNRHAPGGPAAALLSAVPTLLAVLALNVVVLVEPLSFARAAVGFPVAVILPGRLALAIIGGRRRGWDRLLHSVALSLVVLMVVGLVLALMPGPALTTRAGLLGLDAAVVLLSLAVVARRLVRRVVRRRRESLESPAPGVAATAEGDAAAVARRLPGTWLNHLGRVVLEPTTQPGGVAGLVGVVAGVIAVALVVPGAMLLNSGDTGAVAINGLVWVVVAFAAAMVAARRHRTGAATTTIYLISLAILLATSLRGTVVTGHDIKIEYRVFLDTLISGSWRPGGTYPGYNSCLSLTVLPSLLAKLTGLAALDVFRVCFQLVFALVPVGALLVARRLVRPMYAVLSAGLFVAFPTFVNDMPMLNRQEIALLFFTVALLALLDPSVHARRTAMFVIAAAGLTVSHYSTAGVAAFLFILAWLLHLVWALIARRTGKPPRIGEPRRTGKPHPRPGQGMGALVLTTMVVWWSVLTGSVTAFGGELADTARGAITGAAVRSDASRYGPHAEAPVDDAAALRQYTEQLEAQRVRSGYRLGPAATAPVILPADELPATVLGEGLTSAGLSPSALNKTVRQVVVLLFEVGAPLGCLLLWVRTRSRRPGPRRALQMTAEWATAAVALLAIAIAIPQFTDSYGLLRVYQQMLPVLGVAVGVALVWVLRLVFHPRARGRPWVDAVLSALLTAIVTGALVTTTGLLPRATGDFPPQLNLADAGPYYRAYFAGPDDVAMADMIRRALPAGAWLVADSRDSVNLRALAARSPDEGLVPGTIPEEAYLLVQVDSARTAVAVAVIGDRVVRYRFPLTDVAGGRRVVASTSSHLLYSPRGG